MLGRESLREAKAFGLTGRWVAGDSVVSERRALPPRASDHYLKLTQMGSCRTRATMHWRLNSDHLPFDIDGLDIHKLLDAEAGKLATGTALLYPAKWESRIGADKVVHKT